MKLTNPETIKESEKDFIDTINAELDWEAIEKMLLEKHSFTLQEEIEYKDGNLVVYNDDIAYRFDFEIKVPLSVIFNREGDCLEISTVRDDFADDDLIDIDPDDTGQAEGSEKNASGNTVLDQTDADMADTETPEASVLDQKDKVAQMASNISEMISEINQGDE